MKKMKRGIAGFLACVCCMAMLAMQVSANSASVKTDGYGTLTGSLSGTRTKVTSVTSVGSNPDNAYLIAKLDAKNTLGTNVHTVSKQSSRGKTKYTFDWLDLNSSCVSVYGTQGVEGGSTHPAYAVYTYTTF